MAALAALMLALVVVPAQAGWWSGEQPGPRTRLGANGEWDTPVVRQPNGDVRLFDVGEGPTEPYHPDFSVPRGDVVVMHPLVAMGDREMQAITIRRSGQLLAKIYFGRQEVRLRTGDPREPSKRSFRNEVRWVPVRVEGEAHIVSPPRAGVEDGPDTDEEEWLAGEVRRVVRERWKVTVTGGHPVYVLVNTGLLPQGGESWEFLAEQAGKHPLNGASSISFVTFEPAWLELPPEDLCKRFPQGMPYGGGEVKGVMYDFDRGVVRGEDGVERPIAPASRVPAPQPQLQPQPASPVAPPAQYYSEPVGEADDGCTCEGERKLIHQRAAKVGYLVTCAKILTPCEFQVQSGPAGLDPGVGNPFVLFLLKDGKIFRPGRFRLVRGDGEQQAWLPNNWGMLQMDAPGTPRMEEDGVKPGEKIKFGYDMGVGTSPIYIGEATIPPMGRGLWLAYDMDAKRGK